jgi:hypothetical protein
MVNEVWDPKVTAKVTATYSSESPLSNGTQFSAPIYTVGSDEVIEIYRIEYSPPISDTTLQKTLLEIAINDRVIDSIKIASNMMPIKSINAGLAVDLGKPLLHAPISGVPLPIENTTIKAKVDDVIKVIVTALEDVTAPFKIYIKFARVIGKSKLTSVVPIAAMPKRVELLGDVYDGRAVPISVETWNELPGGNAQEKPQIFPFITWSTNKNATTPNKEYSFSYPDNVDNQWQALFWKLSEKREAYIFNYLGVHPHANQIATRFFVDTRFTNPWFDTLPQPDYNEFIPASFFDNSVNTDAKRLGPTAIVPPFLFHGVTGGIQILDNGTAIPAYGVQVDAYGVKIVLK